MGLKVGDLVRHNSNGNYGIVVVRPYRWGDCLVCKVQWCFNEYSHLIDIDFLDKINKT